MPVNEKIESRERHNELRRIGFFSFVFCKLAEEVGFF